MVWDHGVGGVTWLWPRLGGGNTCGGAAGDAVELAANARGGRGNDGNLARTSFRLAAGGAGGGGTVDEGSAQAVSLTSPFSSSASGSVTSSRGSGLVKFSAADPSSNSASSTSSSSCRVISSICAAECCPVSTVSSVVLSRTLPLVASTRDCAMTGPTFSMTGMSNAARTLSPMSATDMPSSIIF